MLRHMPAVHGLAVSLVHSTMTTHGHMSDGNERCGDDGDWDGDDVMVVVMAMVMVASEMTNHDCVTNEFVNSSPFFFNDGAYLRSFSITTTTLRWQ